MSDNQIPFALAQSIFSFELLDSKNTSNSLQQNTIGAVQGYFRKTTNFKEL